MASADLRQIWNTQAVRVASNRQHDPWAHAARMMHDACADVTVANSVQHYKQWQPKTNNMLSPSRGTQHCNFHIKFARQTAVIDQQRSLQAQPLQPLVTNMPRFPCSTALVDLRLLWTSNLSARCLLDQEGDLHDALSHLDLVRCCTTILVQADS
jgi:hypothetical protein